MLTIDEIRTIAKQIGDKHHLKRIYLFGSYARGEATENSDVDILIDTTDAVRDYFELGGIYQDFRDALGVEMDMVTTGARKRFLDNIDKDKVLLYGA